MSLFDQKLDITHIQTHNEDRTKSTRKNSAQKYNKDAEVTELWMITNITTS